MAILLACRASSAKVAWPEQQPPLRRISISLDATIDSLIIQIMLSAILILLSLVLENFALSMFLRHLFQLLLLFNDIFRPCHNR